MRPRPRIDFTDIPEASSKQLRAMRRVGRPPLGVEARRLIAIRIDPQVLDAVRREAKQRGLGYQSLINRLFVLQNFKTQQDDQAAQAEGEQVLNLIEMYRALGGGWPTDNHNQPCGPGRPPANPTPGTPVPVGNLPNRAPRDPLAIGNAIQELPRAVLENPE